MKADLGMGGAGGVVAVVVEEENERIEREGAIKRDEESEGVREREEEERVARTGERATLREDFREVDSKRDMTWELKRIIEMGGGELILWIRSLKSVEMAVDVVSYSNVESWKLTCLIHHGLFFADD